MSIDRIYREFFGFSLISFSLFLFGSLITFSYLDTTEDLLIVDKEFKNMKLATPVNEGWIFSKDRKSIKLFASYDKEDDGTITFGDRTMIPKSWIVKITEI